MSEGLSEAAIVGIARDASLDYLTHPDTHKPFTVNQIGEITLGCIEPRDQEGIQLGHFDIVKQGPGGGTGEGMDTGIALTIVNDRLATPQTGMDYDKEARPGIILAGHRDCTFLLKVLQVASEMSNPSEFTLVSAEKMARQLGILTLYRRHLHGVILASEIIREHLSDQAEILDHDLPAHSDPLLEHADNLHPNHDNVVDVQGRNIARVYVTSFMPKLGQNRNNKSSDPTIRDMQQGYYDGLGAFKDSLDPDKTKKMTDAIRQRKLVARVLRSAATRTLITANNREEMVFLTVKPSRKTKSGLRVVEGLSDEESAVA